MIEYLLTMWFLQQCEALEYAPPQRDYLDSCLDIGAGLDYEPPARQRPDLRLVK